MAYAWPVARSLKTGQVVDGRYQVRELLGQGSAARVYAALDITTDNEIALKVLRDAIAGDEAQRARFAREAKLQAVVAHRNVAQIYGSGTTSRGAPYLALELLRGRSLRDVIRADAPLGAKAAASYCWQALKGLEATHAHGILHRDLKPGNLMLEPSPGPIERVVLIDFGFASLRGGGRITATGQVVGSLGYLAPERLLGQEDDPRSDLYGVGIILFELVCGRRPFVAGADMALVTQHLEAPVPTIASVDETLNVPADLEELINLALAKKPNDRYASAAIMAERLAEIAQTIGS